MSPPGIKLGINLEKSHTSSQYNLYRKQNLQIRNNFYCESKYAVKYNTFAKVKENT